MAKKRSWEKQRNKKYITIGIVILFLFSIIGYFFYSDNSNQELFVSGDISRPPTHYDYISFGNPNLDGGFLQAFTFVQEEVALSDYVFTDYKYKKSVGIAYYKGNKESLVIGKSCETSDLIKFTYCDNSYDKSSCKADMFDLFWYVNYNGEYINLKNYYTGNSDGFYYTYSCYESDRYKYISVPDDIEKKYLYERTCINEENPNYKNGVNYGTETNCLEALEIIIIDESNNVDDKQCDYKLYSNDFVCIGNNIYQKERQLDCRSDYTKYTEKCFYGCSNGDCLPEPQKTCSYEEFDNFKCINGIKYQEVQERNCDIGFTLPIELCGDNDDNSENNIINDSTYNCYICEESGLIYKTLENMPNNWNCQEFDNILYSENEFECSKIKPELFNNDEIKETLSKTIYTIIVIGYIGIVIIIFALLGGYLGFL